MPEQLKVGLLQTALAVQAFLEKMTTPSSLAAPALHIV